METMELIILGCAVNTEVKDDGVEYLCIEYNATPDYPGGKRYSMSRNIPMVDFETHKGDREEWVRYNAQVWVAKLLYRANRVTYLDIDLNDENMFNEMEKLMNDGIKAYFETGKPWSKNLREVHDIKAGSMITDVTSSEEYLLERDIRVVTSIVQNDAADGNLEQ